MRRQLEPKEHSPLGAIPTDLLRKMLLDGAHHDVALTPVERFDLFHVRKKNILPHRTKNSVLAKGVGAQIIKRSFEIADGDVKLHVEYDNPAKRLYERLGMTSKYAEMRFIK